jgi:hypothetical protein
VLGPLVLVSSGGFVASAKAAAAPGGSPIFQPWQVWWFFGHHGALVHGLFGTAKPGYRTGPGWTGAISHPLVLVAGGAVAVAVWMRSGRRTALGQQDALLTLALVLLLRCLLDTWDTSYYPLPFLLALLAWEVGTPSRKLPLLALNASLLMWVSFQWLSLHVSADARAALFLAWTLPLAAWLGLRLFASGSRERERQETTVSALGRPVRTS